MFDKYEEYYEADMRRIARNQRFAWGLNFGQWPAYVVEKLQAQGRRPPTLNVLGKKIQSQIGSFMSNDFDVRYAPINGKVDSLTQKLQDMFYSDKNNLMWKVPESIALRDMFGAGVGYERMVISDQFDEMGNISWEAINPMHVYLDIGWKGGDVSKIRHYFEWGMFYPSEIAEMFPNVGSKIDDLKEREETDGVDCGEYHGGPTPYGTTEDKWGSAHKVIIFHSVKIVERWWEYDLLNQCNFPETGYEPQSDEDKAAKTEYIKMMGLNPARDICTRKQIRRVKYIEVICPTIDSELFLVDGKDRVQTNNCNIYPLGDCYNGQFKGTTDDLYDLQVMLNKGEMNIDDIQTRSAKGAFLLDQALAAGDVNKMREIEANWNNPAARMWVDEGSTSELGPHGGVIPLPGVAPTPDMFKQNDRRLDLIDRLSMVPSAMDSRTESSGESGKLYQSKVQVALVGQRYQLDIFENHKRNKSRAYLIQAKITYKGFPRTFARSQPGDTFTVNKPIEGPDGTMYVMDDISKLPDMLVSIVPSKSGVNVRTELRTQYAESLQLLVDPADRLARLCVLSALYETYELPEETKQEISMAFQMLKTNAAMVEAMNNMAMRQKMQTMSSPQQQIPQEEPPQQQISQGQPTREEAVEGTPQEEMQPEEVLA
jgi:hypothetical protein